MHPQDWSHCPRTGKAIGAGKGLIGRVIAGRYRVDAMLGSGGMGTVYAAQHLLLDQRVALKRLHPELASDESSVARFLREARAAAAIGHPCIVNVLDVGFAEDRAPFIVMELLEGESLASCITREKRLTPGKIADIVCSVLDALEVVHARGIVHRDLKPDNVFLVGRENRVDSVKLLDFGISKIRDFDGMPTLHTHTGVMLGTPQYMSPEQARGMRGIDHRADLYAAGVILYESLTGRIPFEAANYHALLQLILAGTPKSLSELAPDIPPALVSVVETAMSRTPDARYQTAKAMRFALNAFASRSKTPFADTGARAIPRALLKRIDEDATQPARITSSGVPNVTPAPEPERERDVPSPVPVARPVVARPVSGPLARPTPSSGPRLTPRSTPFPGLEEDAPRPASGDNVRGAMMLGAFEHIRSTYGDDSLTLVRSAMSPESRKLLEAVIRPAGFTPIVVFEEFVDTCERLLGKELVEMPRAMGRTIASRELTASLRTAVAGATANTITARLPLVWTALFDVGFATVSPSDSVCMLEVRGAPIRSQAHALLLTGLFARLVESSGAKDVRAYLVHTRAPHAALSMHIRFR